MQVTSHPVSQGNVYIFFWKIFFPCVLCSTFNSIFLVKVYVGIKALVTSSFVHDVAETKYKRIYVFTVFRIYISRRFFIILIMIGRWYQFRHSSILRGLDSYKWKLTMLGIHVSIRLYPFSMCVLCNNTNNCILCIPVPRAPLIMDSLARWAIRYCHVTWILASDWLRVIR